MTSVNINNKLYKKNKKKALFSVIIPCYNSAATIERTLVSLVQQTFGNFEAIIINDGSEDFSLQVIDKFISKDSRFKLINLVQNRGLSNARNLGLDFSSGKYICFLDADDWWPSDKLEVFKAYFNKGYDFLYSDYTRVYDHSKKETLIKVKRELIYEDLLIFNPIPLSTAVFNSNKLGIIKFRNIKLSEDWIYWLDLFKKEIKSFGINKNLMFYSVSSNALSSNKFLMLHRAWDIYRNYSGFSLMKSSFYLIRFIINGIKKRI